MSNSNFVNFLKKEAEKRSEETQDIFLYKYLLKNTKMTVKYFNKNILKIKFKR